MRLRLKGVLAMRSLTQAELAKATDMSPATIAHLVDHGIWPRNRIAARRRVRDIEKTIPEAGAAAEEVSSGVEEWPQS